MSKNTSGFPLSFANVGETYEIAGIFGDEKAAKHLREIGFYNGATIEVESKTHGGTMVKIGDTKLALDAGICNRIYVKELTKTEEEGLDM